MDTERKRNWKRSGRARAAPTSTFRATFPRALSRIFAFPSLDEGFGMPVLEAMARGVPVVTSWRSALPEVAGDAALLVDPFDVEAIAAALIRLAEDPQLHADLIRRGLERARRFRWESAVERTWKLYHEIK